MNLIVKVFRSFAVTLAGLGALVCLLGIYGVWLTNAHVVKTTKRVSTRIDETLHHVDQRLVPLQSRLETSWQTVGGLQTWITGLEGRELTRKDVVEHQLADKSEVIAEQLGTAVEVAHGLLQALEVADAGIELASSLGIECSAEKMEQLHYSLSRMQGEMDETARGLESLYQRLQEISDEDASRFDGEQIRRHLLRAIAALEAIRIEVRRFDDHLDSVRKQIETMQTKVIRWSYIVAIGLTLVLLWLMAGQLALMRVMWPRGPQAAPK